MAMRGLIMHAPKTATHCDPSCIHDLVNRKSGNIEVGVNSAEVARIASGNLLYKDDTTKCDNYRIEVSMVSQESNITSLAL